MVHLEASAYVVQQMTISVYRECPSHQDEEAAMLRKGPLPRKRVYYSAKCQIVSLRRSEILLQKQQPRIQVMPRRRVYWIAIGHPLCGFEERDDGA